MKTIVVCLFPLVFIPLAAMAGDIVVTPQMQAVHERVLTLDSHLDTPANFGQPDWNILEDHGGTSSQVDYPRMVKGGLDGGFWAIYTAQGARSPAANIEARDKGLKRLIEIRELLAAHPDKFALALTADDASRIVAAGKRVVYISIENATPLAHDPSLLSFYYAQGLRLLGITHFLNNEFGDSSTDPKGAEWHGLSPAGKQLVAEANRLGIVLDQSHASDEVFDDLLALSKVPFIASHSSAKAVYNHPRNLDDERIRKLAARGGVIHVNAYGTYLTELPQDPQRQQALDALRKQFGADENRTLEQTRQFREQQRALDQRYPPRRPTLADFLAHLDHILAVAGPEHTGIGLDWDGGGGTLGLEDVGDLPKITAHLLQKGYSEDQIAAIWSGNTLRVLRQVQDYAGQLATAKP